MKVSSQEYNELLHYAYKFVHAQRLSIDHYDLAHDILLSGKLGAETSLYRLCHQLAPAYKNKNEVYISDVQSFTFQNATIEYKYCYHCDQILPIHEMYAGSNYCKPYWYERAKNKKDEARQVNPPVVRIKSIRIKTEATVLQQRIVERQEKERVQLSDTYLKKMIYRSGENITIEELRARITAKRNKPKEPKSTQLKNKAILKRAELSDNYIKDILVKNGFNRATITPDMVSEKRNSLLAKRLRKTT